MIQMLALIILISSAIVSIFSVLWGWMVFLFPFLFVLVVLISMKQKVWIELTELSPEANLMLKKYGHFYSMPHAGMDFSSAASTIQIFGIIITIINLLKGFWWGIAFAIINWFVMGYVSAQFNPSNFLADPVSQMTHKEIINFIQSRHG